MSARAKVFIPFLILFLLVAAKAFAGFGTAPFGADKFGQAEFGTGAFSAESSVSSGPSSDGILLETGDFMLLESGDFALLE